MPLGISFTQSLTLSRNLNTMTRRVDSSLEKLSTGYRINHAKDDSAGLSISEHLLSQIRGYEQSVRNSQDGTSLLNVAEGATETITENLQRIRELTVQAASDTLGSSERDSISQEINQRMEDIDRISASTKFGDVELLSQNSPSSFNLQVGPNSSDVIDIASALGNMASTAIGLTVAGNVDLSTHTAATEFLDTVDAALANVTSHRSTMGAIQNRLDSVVDNLSVTSMNMSAANSRIRDTDIASETSKLVRNQLLQQFDVSLMAQYNTSMSNLTLGLLSAM
ncbi:MAG: flagellin [Vampirovibrionia bacterium]